MTTLINIAEKIGKDNPAIKVLLSNYSMDKLFDTLPKFIIDEEKMIEHHMDLRVIPSSSIYELRYVKKGHEALLLMHGPDLRQVLINIIIDIIEFRLNNKNFICNNEF
ncbi:MAG: hypothetical protein J1F35_03715 [Erysipelotrichales bacterium]|nr:hypothetical protein [Erysipelotrichales bacterium]